MSRSTQIGGTSLRVHHDGARPSCIELWLDGKFLTTIGVGGCPWKEEAVMRAVKAEEAVLARCGPRHDPFEHGMDEAQVPA